MDPDETKYVPIDDLKVEEGAEELMSSPLMQPYVRLAEAFLTNVGTEGLILNLPSYRWRSVTYGASHQR